MNRITTRMQALAATGRKALIPYVTAGDPSLTVTLPLLHALVEAGADIIELGMPFSDPMADGPVIQQACERALAGGATLSGILQLVQDFRRDDPHTPIVLMGYLNPIEAMGYQTFASRCAEVGVDGLLIVDLPPEEALDQGSVFRDHGLDLVFLIAPTTTEERMALISKACSGYLYYVSLKGVTGAATLNPEEVAGRVETIRKHTALPIGVGFGIKDADAARLVAQIADGVVVGSALVQRIADHADQPELIPGKVAAVIAAMRAAMDRP